MEETHGVIPRAIMDIFSEIEERTKGDPNL
jgi:hypothetical protein